MKHFRLKCLLRRGLMAGVLVCLGYVTTLGSAATQANVGRVPEGVIRKAAKTIVRPTYPVTSKKRGTQGLAVVLLDVNGAGDVTDVSVVEAPDEEIGKSVMDAVRRWKFSQLSAEGKPIKVRGKLSFYFSIRDGKTYVSDPKKFGEQSQRPPVRN
jgi:TonB family protein